MIVFNPDRFYRRAPRIHRFWALMALVMSMVVGASGVYAQERPFRNDSSYLPRNSQKDGRYVLRAFDGVTHDVAPSTVRISIKGETVSLGLIVSHDGYIVTKASEIRDGDPVVYLQSGIQRRADVTVRDQGSDLALLKIAAWDLPSPQWSEESEPGVGRWLATVAPAEDPLAVGVVSLASRKITARSMLGVRLRDSEGGPLVESVLPQSGADDAGIKEGDVIVEIDGQPTPSWEKLIAQIRDLPPGVDLEVVIVRAGERKTLRVTLGMYDSSPDGRASRLNRLGGEVSRRSAGFASAFQHDTVLSPNDCGGPVVDLSGKIVGLNIARAGRTESYAIPTAALRPVVEKLIEDARGKAAGAGEGAKAIAAGGR